MLGNVAKTLGVDPTPPPKPDLHIPEVYLDFFSRTPAFVIVAFCGRHPLAAASDIDGKLRAWRRICGQVSGGVRDPKWLRRESADAISVISA